MLRRSALLCVLAAAGATLFFALSCDPPTPLPGTALGTYNVTGTLVTNTCGTTLGAPNPWTFSTQMSEDGTTLYWEETNSPMLTGTMTSATEGSITSTETANVDATEAGPGLCDLQNATTIGVTLGPGSPPSSFTGTISYVFSAAAGISTTNNCTDQLTASGGSYDTLPCTVTYSLSGASQ